MKWYTTFALLLIGALLIGALAVRPVQAATAADSQPALLSMTSIGTTSPASIEPGSGDTDKLTQEFRPSSRASEQRVRTPSGVGYARVPADHVPSPATKPVIDVSASTLGMEGMSQFDQRVAGTGIYANTQSTLDPPEPAVCVNDQYVLETVNGGIRIFGTDGTPRTPTLSINQFFKAEPAIRRTPTVAWGEKLADPRCFFDSDVNRWFVVVFTQKLLPSGAGSGRTFLDLAVSQTSSPLGTWNVYRIETTNDGRNGVSHAGCPCYPDYPVIGADKYGFHITTNEVSYAGGFHGAQIYAMSKAALVAGTLPPVVVVDSRTLPAPDGGLWYTVQPALNPPGAPYELANGGTQYYLSALDFGGTLDNRIAVWAMTNTSSLDSATPDLRLSVALVDTQVYGRGPDAEQKDGPLPLGRDIIPNQYGSPTEKIALLASNDARMHQVWYADGKLWGATNTVVKTDNGPVRVGAAYFILSPSATANSVSATVVKQGYVAVNRNNLLFPAIGVTAAGKGVINFSLAGPDYYPSAAYAPLDAVSGAGDVRLVKAGVGPLDSYTGYQHYFPGDRTARWGDYFGAAAAPDGSIWISTEYIGSGPRTSLTNWGSYISRVIP